MTLVSARVNPHASVMATENVSATRPEISSVVAALDHRYAYGEVPPETVRSTDPSLPALQLTSNVVTASEGASGSSTEAETITADPQESVTLTVYVRLRHLIYSW